MSDEKENKIVVEAKKKAALQQIDSLIEAQRGKKEEILNTKSMRRNPFISGPLFIYSGVALLLFILVIVYEKWPGLFGM